MAFLRPATSRPPLAHLPGDACHEAMGERNMHALMASAPLIRQLCEGFLRYQYIAHRLMKDKPAVFGLPVEPSQGLDLIELRKAQVDCGGT
jgi:hypothetical protein